MTSKDDLAQAAEWSIQTTLSCTHSAADINQHFPNHISPEQVAHRAGRFASLACWRLLASSVAVDSLHLISKRTSAPWQPEISLGVFARVVLRRCEMEANAHSSQPRSMVSRRSGQNAASTVGITSKLTPDWHLRITLDAFKPSLTVIARVLDGWRTTICSRLA